MFTRGNPQVFQHQISSHSETKQKIQASGSIWTDDRIILFECIQNMNFFMLLGNHFLSFQHFSLSFFFPKCRNWGAHYTRMHTIWYINAGLLEKEKNRLFQASIHWGTVRSKVHYFFYWSWGMNIFFLFIEKVLEKSYLYCFGVPNYLLQL